MLRELGRGDWLTILGLPEARIPKALILRGTRNLKVQYEVHRRYFQNVLDVGSPNGVLEDVLVGELDGVHVAYASVYGAPMASEVVHVFGVLGTPLVVQTGCCGALADTIGPGDLFIVQEAFCGEGASQYYTPGKRVVAASFDIGTLAGKQCPEDVALHRGRVYTTSALFAEGQREVEDWFKRGFSAVDMETAATFAVAEHFGMERASILFAFDNPRRQDHIFLSDGEKDERRARGNELMKELAFDAIRRHLSSCLRIDHPNLSSGRGMG